MARNQQLQWARQGESTLAMAVRAQAAQGDFPDAYSDLSDHELEALVERKYPGAYSDLLRTVPPGQTAEGLNQYQADRARGFKPKRTVAGTVAKLVTPVPAALSAPSRARDLAITAASQSMGAALGTPIALADIATSLAGRGTPAGDAMARTRGGSIGARQRGLESFYTPAQQKASRNVEEAEGIKETAAAAIRNPSVIAQTLVGAVPHMAAGGLVGRGIIAAAGRYAPSIARTAIPRIAPALGEGAVSGAQTAAQIREQTGELTPGQAGLAVTSGALTALFARIGGGMARKLGVTDIDDLLAGVQTDSYLRTQVTRRILSAALQEGVLEELPQSIQEQVLQNKATGQPLDTGVDQAAVLGLIAGGLMGGGTQVGRAPTPPLSAQLAAEAKRASKAYEESSIDRDTLVKQGAPQSDIDLATEESAAAFEDAQKAIVALNKERQRLGLSTPEDTAPTEATPPVDAEAIPGVATGPPEAPVQPVQPVVPPEGPVPTPLPPVAPTEAETGPVPPAVAPGVVPAETTAADPDVLPAVAGMAVEGPTEPPKDVSALRGLVARYGEQTSPYVKNDTDQSARFTPATLYQLRRMRDELEGFKSEPGVTVWNEDGPGITVERRTPPSPRARVAEDIEASSHRNRNAKSSATSYKRIVDAVNVLLKPGQSRVHNNVAEGALRVAEMREADDFTDIHHPQLEKPFDETFKDTSEEQVTSARKLRQAWFDAGEASTEVADLLFALQPESDNYFRDIRAAEEALEQAEAEHAEARDIYEAALNDLSEEQRAQLEAEHADEGDVAPGVDVLKTGESQVRLPEAGEVRDVDVATPEVADLLFALQPEAGVPTTGEVAAQQPALLDAPDTDVDDEGDLLMPRTREGDRQRPARKIGAPTTGTTSISSIIASLRKGLGNIPLIVERLQQVPRDASGVFRPGERSIAMRRANNLSTYLHEAGHDMDISLLHIPRSRRPWTMELLALGERTSLESYTQTKRLKEGAAEFFRMYLENPTEAQDLAPAYFKEFESQLAQYPQVSKILKQAQADIDQLGGFSAGERITQAVRYTPPWGARLSSTLKSMVDTVRPPPQNLIYDDQVAILKKSLMDATTPAARTAIENEIRQIENRRLPRTLSTAVQEVAIDDLVGLKQAVLAMAAGHPLATIENAYAMARLARGSGGIAADFVESPQGVTLSDGTSLGPSLKQALEPVMGAFRKGDQQLFENYLVALRTIELHGRGKDPGISESDARAYIQEVEQRPDFAEFEKARDAVYAHQDAVLEYAIDGGLLTQELASKIRQANRFYVPFNRAQDDDVEPRFLEGGTRQRSGVRGSIAGQRPPMYRIGESGKDLLPVLQQIIANDFSWVSAVEKNRAMLALTNQATGGLRGQRGKAPPDSARWLRRIPAPVAAVRFAGQQLKTELTKRLDETGIELPPEQLDDLLDIYVTVFTPTQLTRKGDNVVSVMKKGKREFWQVNNQSLFNAISAVGPQDIGRWMKWAQAPARLLRAGATLSPGFILRNPVRDTLVAWVQSRHGFIPGVDTVIGLYEQFRPDSVARDLFYRNGIAQATLAGNDRSSRELALKNLGKTELQRTVVRSPIDLMRALSSQMEVASRLGEFKLALQAGGQERGVLGRLFGPQFDPNAWDANVVATAALAARDVTTDFQRAGSVGREINRVDAFFNAQVQGAARMAETAQRDPVGMSLKLGLMGLMSTAIWFGNAEDDEYRELPEWEKHTYWHVKLPGNTTWFRIPKPFEYGYLADFVEAGLDFIAKEDPRRLKQIKDQLVGDSWGKTAANLIISGVLPPLEVWANYNSFRDTDIVRHWDLELDSDLQYNDFTSDTAKVLGKIISVAPANIDHLIFGYTASLGRIAVGGIDLALQSLGAADPSNRPTRQAQHRFVVGNFLRTRSFGASSQSIQDIYDFSTAVGGLEASQQADRDRGDRARGRRREEKLSQEWWWPRRDAILAERKRFKVLGKRIRGIYDAPESSLTMYQKRTRLDLLYEDMSRGAANALGRRPARARQEEEHDAQSR
jgi:hypothetical protein